MQSTSISTLCWPKDRHNEIIFGLVDGKLKLGALKNNKPYNLYVHPDGSPVVALASSPNGKIIVTSHQDGSIWRFSFPDEGEAAPGHVQIARHPCMPSSLGCGEAIAVSGSDCKVNVAMNCLKESENQLHKNSQASKYIMNVHM